MHKYEVHLCGMKSTEEGDTFADRDEAEYYCVYVRAYEDEETWDYAEEEDIINYGAAYQRAAQLREKYRCEIDEY